MNIQEVQAKIKALPGKLIDEIVMLRLANGAVAIIRKRVGDGQYLEGSSPNAGEYSTTPMPLPFGKFQATVRKKLSKAEQNKDKYILFTSKQGNTWILLQGGYKEFRKLAGKFNDHVVMSWTGRMMRNLGIISGEKDNNTVTYNLGFSDPDIERIARYHNIDGAGRSRRRHVFFDLSKEERAQLEKLAGEAITKNLLKSLS